MYCGRRQGGVRGVVGLATCWLHPQAIYGLPHVNEASLGIVKQGCLCLKELANRHEGRLRLELEEELGLVNKRMMTEIFLMTLTSGDLTLEEQQTVEKAGHKELSFTPREWNLLKELVEILKPFGEATDLTQGEKVVTISAVVPSVLSLNHHLEKLKTQVRFLSGLVRILQASLNKRFLGIFINVKMARTQDGITAPFSDPVYLKTAALDPAFSLLWVEPHVLVNRDIKAEVAQRVKELILQDAAETEQPVLLVDEE
ncbi:unnamed protein product [Boreogadus saida]